jgi:hypothetical protein
MLLSMAARLGADEGGLRWRAQDAVAAAAGEILELEIERLRESGLRGSPVHETLEAWRGHLLGLVEEALGDAAAAWVDAARAGALDARLAAIRAGIRAALLRAALEGGPSSRRLWAAELLARARRALDAQSAARALTAAAASGGSGDSGLRPRIEAQERAAGAIGALAEALRRAFKDGGALHDAVEEGLLILENERVAEALDRASAFALLSRDLDATAEQAAVMRGLRLVVARIEEARGVAGRGSAGGLDRVRSLARRLERLRQRVQESVLEAGDVAALVEEQLSLREELERLIGEPPPSLSVLTLLEEAAVAADEAVIDLFEERREEALAGQSRFLGLLRSIEGVASTPPAAGRRVQDAPALLDRARILEELRRSLHVVRERQLRMRGALAEDLRAAWVLADEIAGGLESLRRDMESAAQAEDGVPERAALAFHRAVESAQAVAAALDDRVPGEIEALQAASAAAQEAIEACVAEVEEAAAAARERAALARAGAFARAAGDLAAAVTAERNIAAREDVPALGASVGPALRDLSSGAEARLSRLAGIRARLEALAESGEVLAAPSVEADVELAAIYEEALLLDAGLARAAGDARALGFEASSPAEGIRGREAIVASPLERALAHLSAEQGRSARSRRLAQELTRRLDEVEALWPAALGEPPHAEAARREALDALRGALESIVSAADAAVGGAEIAAGAPAAAAAPPGTEAMAPPAAPESAIRDGREAPWFAALPPEWRRLLRERALDAPPAAHRERLRRYFEAIDDRARGTGATASNAAGDGAPPVQARGEENAPARRP